MEGRRLLAFGDVDATFAGAGAGLSQVVTQALTVTADGRIVRAGFISGDSSGTRIHRLLPDGGFDPTFDGDGELLLGGLHGAKRVLSVPGGKLLVFGHTLDRTSIVTRLNPDGTRDASFGVGGVAPTGLGQYGELQDAALLADGRIVLAGREQDTVNSNGTVSVARLTADGALDATFAGDGKYDRLQTIGGLFAPTADVQASSIRLVPQPDGRVVVAAALSPEEGSPVYKQHYFRLTATGEADTTLWSVGGFRFDPTPGDDSARDVAPLPDGGFFNAGRYRGAAAVWKFDAGLNLVASFGHGGVSTVTSPGSPNLLHVEVNSSGDAVAIATGQVQYQPFWFDAASGAAIYGAPNVPVGLTLMSVANVAAGPGDALVIATGEYQAGVRSDQRLGRFHAGVADGLPPAPADVGFDGGAMNEGTSQTLSGYANGLAAGQSIASWQYDLNYDGANFDADAVGREATLVAAEGPASRTVAVRVTDNFGRVVTRSRSIRFDNVAPTATFAGTVASNAATATFSNSFDPSALDGVMKFRYSFDFNGDGDFGDPGDVYQSAVPTATFHYAANGVYAIGGRIEDKDGGFTNYVATVRVGAAPPAPANVGFDNYFLDEGASQTLFGYATGLAAGQSIVKWEYDFNYDGLTFDVDATGQRPTFTAGDGPAGRPVGIRVTDNFGQVVTKTQTLRIDNVAPTATFSAAASANTVTATFAGPIDPGVTDRAAGFKYSFDFNNDGDFTDAGDVYRSTSASASFAYAAAGGYTVRGRIEDKDGGFTDYSAFATAAGNPNVAAGKATTASSTAAGSSPANATDLSLSSEWVAGTAGDAFLRVDLGAFYQVSSIAAVFGASGIPSSFAIQASVDGITYATLASYSSNFSSSKTVSGPTGAVRYVRLNFTVGTSPYRVTDLRVYGAAVSLAPPVPTFNHTDVIEDYGGTFFGAARPGGTDRPIAKWEWDFDYDGATFTVDAATQTANLSSTGTRFDGPATRQVALRVTDSAGLVGIVVQPVPILNAAPYANLGIAANANGSATATFTGMYDSAADLAAGLRYSFDFNNDGDFADAGETSNSTSPTATFAFATSGTYTVRGRVADKDGAFNDYARPVTVTVPTTPPPGTTPTRLTGIGIGTAGSFGGSGNTFAKALDDNLATYFDATVATGAWVGLDLGTARSITQVSFAPRTGWAARMIGGTFQGSNDANFATGVATLATVATKPAEGVITSLAVTNASTFRYVRYLAPAGSYGNVAEVRFFTGGGTTTPPTTPPTPPAAGQLTGALIGTAGSFGGGANTIAKAVDGNLASYFDGPAADNQWVGHDLGTAKIVTSVSFAPRAGWETRTIGGLFQGSNDPTFATGVATLATVATKPTAGVLTSLTVTGASAYRYVRYLAPRGSYGNVAEVKFFGGGTTTPTPPTPPATGTPLTGGYIGTAGSFGNSGNTGAKLFDGQLSTFFDSSIVSNAWAGLDLGTARTITSIRYAPRGGWSARMLGGLFQGSNDANFATGVTTLATISAKPAEGVLTSVNVTAAGSFRYVRYLAPANSYGNAAEVQFFG